MEELRAARRSVEGTRNEIETVTRKRDVISVSTELLDREEAITNLHGRVAQYRSARDDRPALELERNNHVDRAEQLWRESELRGRAVHGASAVDSDLETELTHGVRAVIDDLSLDDNADSKSPDAGIQTQTVGDRVTASSNQIRRVKNDLEISRDALRNGSASSVSMALMAGSVLAIIGMVAALLVTGVPAFVGITVLIVAAVVFAFGLYRRLESVRRMSSLTERIDRAKRYIDELTDIQREFDEITKLNKRIGSIDNTCRQFETDAEHIRNLIPDNADVESDRVVERLNRELGPAKELRSKYEQYTEQLEKLNDNMRKAQQQELSAQTELNELCRIAKCDNHEELERVEKQYRQRESLRKELHGVERDLGRICGDPNEFEAFVESVRSADEDQIAEDIEALTSKESELDAELKELLRTIGAKESERDRMDGSDEAAIAADEAQSVLAGLRTDVDRYVRVKLAHRILRDEIEKYRAENQGPILKAASGFFARLTLGSFAGLKTEYDETDKPTLMGIRADEERNLVSTKGMSEGTADQLYLALRLAALEQYVSRNKPLPFIVDDILIKFDDDRARAALEVLTDLSDRVQVLFFTHHMRLREMAEDLRSSHNGRVFVRDLHS